MLAAIVYQAGFRIDELMVAVAEALEADGLRLHGVVQRNGAEAACSTMSLVDLATGARCTISQRLGPHARGCRLDSQGLAAAAAALDRPIDDGVDLLILNKFGKAEAEGNGLRSAFARAIEAQAPALTAVRPPYLEAWSAFHGGLAADLAPDLDAVLAWCRPAVGARRAAQPSLRASTGSPSRTKRSRALR